MENVTEHEEEKSARKMRMRKVGGHQHWRSGEGGECEQDEGHEEEERHE